MDKEKSIEERFAAFEGAVGKVLAAKLKILYSVVELQPFTIADVTKFFPEYSDDRISIMLVTQACSFGLLGRIRNPRKEKYKFMMKTSSFLKKN